MICSGTVLIISNYIIAEVADARPKQLKLEIGLLVCVLLLVMVCVCRFGYFFQLELYTSPWLCPQCSTMFIKQKLDFGYSHYFGLDNLGHVTCSGETGNKSERLVSDFGINIPYLFNQP